MPTRRNERIIFHRIKIHHPAAQNIRRAGHCPLCGSYVLYSYQLPGAQVIQNTESCRFFCGACGWLSVGTRKLTI